jgi:prepilin-type N-terminal cleavage/methylation domain-containing protein
MIKKLSLAFTLIELSIVLVIIGLFAGGILVGKDLIHAAEIRSQIKQFQEYEIAYNTFKIKYNCTVGDCQSATSIFGSTDSTGTAITNGNGNGRIDTANGTYANDGNSTWALSTEMWGAFQQLGLANLVSFIPKTPSIGSIGGSHPTISLNNKAGFFFCADYNFIGGRFPDISAYRKGVNALWFVHASTGATTNLLSFDDAGGIFLASDLQQVDQKLDDGKPLSGKLIGFGDFAGSPSHNCVSGAGVNAVYDTSYTNAQCTAAYVVE